MKVTKADSAIVPSYPDAKEFLRKRQILGVAILGAGVALTGCDESRDGGVRTSGAPACPKGEPSSEVCTTPTAPTEKQTENVQENPHRLLGKIAVEPKLDPPGRLKGDVMVEPREDVTDPEAPPSLRGVSPPPPPPPALPADVQ